jgi:inner membrane protein
MPLPITHALAPLAGALVRSNRPIPWRLVIAAAVASALPDIDSWSGWIWGMPSPDSPLPPWWHRGATHSLFVAIAAGCFAAAFHRPLRVRALTAGAAVAAAMASHGILDMLTDDGVPVAYLWPLSSARLFADWRPLHSGPIQPGHMVSQSIARLGSEALQLILPMFALALAIRGILALRSRWIGERPSADGGVPAIPDVGG